MRESTKRTSEPGLYTSMSLFSELVVGYRCLVIVRFPNFVSFLPIGFVDSRRPELRDVQINFAVFSFFQEFVVHLRETEIHSNLGNDLCYFFVLVLFVNVNFDLNVNLDFCKRTLLYVYLNIVQPCSKILRQILYFCFNNVCSVDILTIVV